MTDYLPDEITIPNYHLPADIRQLLVERRQLMYRPLVRQTKISAKGMAIGTLPYISWVLSSGHPITLIPTSIAALAGGILSNLATRKHSKKVQHLERHEADLKARQIKIKLLENILKQISEHNRSQIGTPFPFPPEEEIHSTQVQPLFEQLHKLTKTHPLAYFNIDGDLILERQSKPNTWRLKRQEKEKQTFAHHRYRLT